MSSGLAALGRALRGLGTVLLLLPLRFYRRWISPALPPSCRYYPSCAAYAEEALTLHGPLKGSWLAVRRLGRCHPWTAGGVDHVPGSPKAVASQPHRATADPSTSTGA
jgi:putative membrane protein insertion efficiency factor